MSFKIGDRVRVISHDYDKANCTDDDYINYGEIVTIVSGGKNLWSVRGDNAKTDWNYWTEELEAIEEEKSMSKNIAMIVNSTGCTVVIGTDVHTVAKDHPNFTAIQEAYAAGDAEELAVLISVRKALESFAEGTNITIRGGQLFYGDREMKNGLARRIIQLMQEGREGFAKPLVAFMENLMLNPSYRAVEGLYEWLERSNLPITPDGCFIAWKMIRNDYTDIRTGKFDNSVGTIVEIPRNQVDEDPNRTCSYGLHFCSNEYLDSGYAHGGKTVMVKVNPRDVGAFPHDYNISKGRCCRYEVIEEVTREEAKTRFTKTPTAVYRGGTKIVERLDTRNDRAEITLVFTDGTTQTTKNRLGDTTTFEQRGNVVTLLPSGRTITIK